MIRRSIVYRPEAEDDLIAIYEWIAAAGSPWAAASYVERIEDYIAGFEIGAARGSPQDHIRPGMRTVGFQGRVLIAFTLTDQRVTVLPLLYGGQDWQRRLKLPDPP